MQYVTSDPHFGHKKIPLFCPTRAHFMSIEEHDETLIENINTTVGKKDKLYILGDFTMSRDPNVIRAYRERIECDDVSLILGNHDQGPASIYPKLFRRVEGALKLAKNKLILTHIPIEGGSIAERFRANLHGHIHDTWQTRVAKGKHASGEEYEARWVHVGVDAWALRPVSIRQIVEQCLS